MAAFSLGPIDPRLTLWVLLRILYCKWFSHPESILLSWNLGLITTGPLFFAPHPVRETHGAEWFLFSCLVSPEVRSKLNKDFSCTETKTSCSITSIHQSMDQSIDQSIHLPFTHASLDCRIAFSPLSPFMVSPLLLPPKPSCSQ